MDEEEDYPQYNRGVRKLLEKEHSWKIYGNFTQISCCNFKLFVGPVRSWWWLLEFFTVATALSFVIESIYYCEFPLGFGITIIILFFAAIISSWKTIVCDPGIVPRPPFEEALANAKQVAEKMKKLGGFFQPKKDVKDENGNIIRWEYCYICNNFRPPKSDHCEYCDACIENFDHFCPVFGGCVGKNNLLSFYVMCISVPAYHSLMIANVLAIRASRQRMDYLCYIMKYPTVILYIIGIIVTFLVPYIAPRISCENCPKDDDSTFNTQLPEKVRRKSKRKSHSQESKDKKYDSKSVKSEESHMKEVV